MTEPEQAGPGGRPSKRGDRKKKPEPDSEPEMTDEMNRMVQKPWNPDFEFDESTKGRRNRNKNQKEPGMDNTEGGDDMKDKNMPGKNRKGRGEGGRGGDDKGPMDNMDNMDDMKDKDWTKKKGPNDNMDMDDMKGNKGNRGNKGNKAQGGWSWDEDPDFVACQSEAMQMGSQMSEKCKMMMEISGKGDKGNKKNKGKGKDKPAKVKCDDMNLKCPDSQKCVKNVCRAVKPK